MKMSVEELNTVIAESKKQVFQWKNKAMLEHKQGKVDATLEAVLNKRVRWWYNPVTDELRPMANENLNKRPTVSPFSYFHDSTINNLWVLVFNTNRGILVR